MSPKASAEPTAVDVDALLNGLKPFQRATVDHAFRRLWTDGDSVSRFLVADEVGLGKTLIAKGVAARAIAHLRETTDRTVTIVYICSNSQIAGQNLDRLRELTGGEAQRNADRITMLPQTMGSAPPGGVDLIAFTPGTSLRLGDATGRVGERVLLHWMLSHSIDRLWLTQPRIVDYFRDAVGFRRFADRLEWDWSRPALDAGLVDEFTRTLRTDAGPFGGTLLSDLFDELDQWLGSEEVTREMWWRRRRMIGALRMVMAQTAVTRLAPDLVILDEFQRFKDLFPGAPSTGDEHYSDAQQLAQKIIDHRSAKSLVLSATPYKMFTLPDELDAEDHHQDFHDTIAFLAGPDRADRVREHLAQVREGMLQGTDEGTRRAEEATARAQAELQRVMSRTERLGSTAVADGMLREMEMPSLEVRPRDLEVWTAADAIGRHAHGMDMFEFWRSSPYPVNLMDPSAYVAQRRTLEAARGDDSGDMAHLLHTHRRGLLFWDDIRHYREIDPGNPKLRAMIDAAMDRGVWKLAWLPPSLPYVSPGGPFASEDARSFTKRLVFSAWSVVPKAISALFSYETDRRLSCFAPRHGTGASALYDDPRTSGLLRFTVVDGKLQNLPHLALLQPSVALAQLGDPLAIARATGEELPLAPDRLLQAVTQRIQERLDALDLPVREGKGQTAGWYGVAPYLLDRALGLEDLALRGAVDGATDGDEAGSRYGDHVAFALDPDWDVLGAPPEDLASVLAQVAIAGPGVCALRAVGRATGGEVSYADMPVRRAALEIAEGLRSLFNRPETMAAVRASTDAGSEDTDGYWQLVLRYCLDGNLQSMLDEYVHTLVDSLGLRHDEPAERAATLAERIRATTGTRSAANEIHELSSDGEKVDVSTHKLNSHIAARFGRALSSEAAENREASVRDSFNSPFWPFVLASTSVGQEGLDFHTYSHAIVHWNLPGNPVDLEQREGRVHRYKGHAIRRNIAHSHAGAALAPGYDDPWAAMFDAAVAAEPEDSDGLSPFWLCDGPAKIERYVPAMPLSRESRQYLRLQRTLGAYRSVMGQPRQEDLIKLMGEDVDWPRIDLRPPR
ncbi:helicase [Brachybacterium halotolerans subsp. kimchii]|uniref:helicase-related protein n=1 Tax=Brachybacterium halotolerans TaxID=2795215 RepID=UPI001E3EE136|nr:helicase-related protein [Brachybacterium halotolerans]UEJ81847.1 helicase [Brachybacterium halotolerans subsp. kimchii]